MSLYCECAVLKQDEVSRFAWFVGERLWPETQMKAEEPHDCDDKAKFMKPKHSGVCRRPSLAECLSSAPDEWIIQAFSFWLQQSHWKGQSHDSSPGHL